MSRRPPRPRRSHRLRRSQTHRQGRPLQHRRRPQVHRHDRRSHAPQAPPAEKSSPTHQNARRRHHHPPVEPNQQGAECRVPRPKCGVPGGPSFAASSQRVGYRAERDRFPSKPGPTPSQSVPLLFRVFARRSASKRSRLNDAPDTREEDATNSPQPPPRRRSS
jgi:hypothetical protein